MRSTSLLSPRLSRVLLLTTSALFASTLAPLARAAGPYSKQQCIAADDQVQSLRRDHKLVAARAQLAICADASCPALVRDDCTQRLDDLNRAQPTVVFVAKDASGGDVVDVAVTVDGQPLASRLDGSALPVDPGEHSFTFAPAGGALAPIAKTLVVHEGEKDRRERVVFAPAQAATAPISAPVTASPTEPAATSEPTSATSAPASRGSGQRLGGIILGAGGVVGVGLGAVFGAMASSKWSSAQSECGSSHCGAAAYDQAVNDHNSAQSAATASTIGFIAGGALLAAGAIVFFTAPRGDSPTTGIVVAPSVGASSGGMLVRGSF